MEAFSFSMAALSWSKGLALGFVVDHACAAPSPVCTSFRIALAESTASAKIRQPLSRASRVNQLAQSALGRIPLPSAVARVISRGGAEVVERLRQVGVIHEGMEQARGLSAALARIWLNDSAGPAFQVLDSGCLSKLVEHFNDFLGNFVGPAEGLRGLVAIW